MTYDIDKDYLLDTLRACVEVESPVGYYPEAHEWLREELSEMGYEMTVDNNATAYVRVPGRSAEKVVCLGAHLDTIGLVVRGINDDGTLRVRQLGGINYHSIEGETCTVHCRDGRAVAGQVICDHHSTHVFDDARSRERTEDTMAVSLVADVASAEDARALGVTEGAVVGIDPHFERFDNGYVISRHIDDKAAVAVLLDVLRWLAQTGERPAYDTLFAFRSTRRSAAEAPGCPTRWTSTSPWTSRSSARTTRAPTSTPWASSAPTPRAPTTGSSPTR